MVTVILFDAGAFSIVYREQQLSARDVCHGAVHA
jgi:hypothetical protein